MNEVTKNKQKSIKLDHFTFIEVVKNSPLVSIDLIVRNAQNEVLLGLRNNEPAKNYWFTFGGRIYKNERIAQAFQRIVEEEIGIDVDITDAQFVGVFEHLYGENFAQEPGFGTHYVVLAYEVKVIEPFRGLPDVQHHQYRWFRVEDLLQAHDVHPYTKAYFQDVN